jgi:hypothetical protein
MEHRIALAIAAALAVAGPAVAGDDDDWRDRRTASPREVARSWDRVQDERRDLARAQWRGDRGDIREEARELRRAEREFQRDRADLYRAGWRDDDRWDDDRRGWNRGRGRGRDDDWGWRGDGWNRQGWHAEHFYRDDRRYRQRAVGWNEPVWRGYDNRYYCRRSDGTTGLIVGGLAGGVLGNVLAPGGSKTLGSILGGAAGAVIGNSVDRNRVVCR